MMKRANQFTDDEITQADDAYVKRMKTGSARLRDAIIGREAKRIHIPPVFGWGDVLRVVCKHYCVSPADVRGRNDRHRTVQRARAVTFVALQARGNACGTIGAWFEGRDPSAIAHVVKRTIPALTEVERELVDELAKAKIR